MPDFDSPTRSKPCARAWGENFDLDEEGLLPERAELDSLPDDLGTDYGEPDQEPGRDTDI